MSPSMSDHRQAVLPRRAGPKPNLISIWFAAALLLVLPAARLSADELFLQAISPNLAASTASNTIHIALLSDAERQGLMFDLTYDASSIQPMGVAETGRLRAPVQLQSFVSPPGVLHVLAYDSSDRRTAIPAGEGAIIAVTFAVADTLTSESTEIRIVDAQAASSDLRPIAIASRALAIHLGKSETIQETIPLRFALYQGTPNPSKASTLIRFDVPRPARVRIAIHDLAGRVVRTLADDTFPPGQHTASWDGMRARGARVPAGVYFAVMKSGQFRTVRKMVRID